MALVVPAAGEAADLEAILGQALTLRLFANDATIDNDTEAGDLTEVSGNGYAAIALVSGSWVLSGSNPTLATYPQQTFEFSGAAGPVYGYYVTRDADGALLWAENKGPETIAASGEQIKVTPKRTHGNAS